MLAALAVALIPGRPAVVAAVPAALGLAAGLAYMGPHGLRLLNRHRALAVVPLLALLAIAWMVAGVITAGKPWAPMFPGADGAAFPYRWFDQWSRSLYTSWPWRVGRLPLPALVLTVICACGGFVLVADAIRVQIGLARPARTGWRALAARPTRRGQITTRAVPGVTLICVAAVLGISLANRYSFDYPVRSLIAMLAIGACAAVLLVSPVAIGLYLQLDLDKEGRAREAERRRLAAHLHDSVLQTLALIQRQAADPAAVTRLARRQEIALRAWMAGDAALSSATVVGAVKEMISEVEDEQEITVELSVVGDAPINARSVELISAAREALRNSARHAPGAAINVFLDVGSHGTELFVRDSGPGFEFESVPTERRGLRDAVIGRMQVAGGSATVESVVGEGTEVALKLPHNGVIS